MEIRLADERKERIENAHYENQTGMNNIKVELVDIRNRITQIEHALGVSGQMKEEV